MKHFLIIVRNIVAVLIGIVAGAIGILALANRIAEKREENSEDNGGIKLK